MNKIVNNKNILIIIGIMTISMTIVKLSPESPFSIYSKSPIIDSLKIITLISISAFLLYLISNHISKKLVIIILTALFIRILIVFIMSFFGLLPYQYDNNWDVDASIILQNWYLGNYSFKINDNIVGFYSMLTVIVYYLLGENPIYMQLLNVFFSVLTVYYLFNISNHLFNKKVAYSISILMTFWPSYIFFSVMHMREALAIFFIVVIIYSFIRWLRNFELKYLLLATIFIILSSLIRSQNAVLMLLIVLPFILYYTLAFSKKYLKIIIFFIMLATFIIAFIILKMTGYLDYFNFNYIVAEMNYRSDGGTGYLYWMTYNSILDIVVYSPIRFVYFVFTPFVWHISNISQIAAFFEAIILMGMSYYILKNFKMFWKKYQYKKELIFVICFCLLGLMANGIIDSNVGTAIRHKLQYLFLFFLLFFAIKDEVKTKNKIN